MDFTKLFQWIRGLPVAGKIISLIVIVLCFVVLLFFSSCNRSAYALKSRITTDGEVIYLFNGKYAKDIPLESLERKSDEK